MSRSTATADARGKGAATLAAGVLLVMLGGYAWITLQPVPMAGPPVPGGPAVARGEAVANAWAVAPPPVPMVTSQAPQAPVASAAGPAPVPVHTPSRPADMPYRFVGKSAAGAEPSVVLFGRGRVVTVHGPRALDDEYVVEAVFDDYLVVRHLPTGVGRFLRLAHRQQVVAPRQDPEDSPQD